MYLWFGHAIRVALYLLHLSCNPRISCSPLSNVQLREGLMRPCMCNCAIVQRCAMWEFTLLQVSGLCKCASFLPPLRPRGNNSRLRGENEHLAWRQELVRMARSPPKLARHSVPQHCHSAIALPQKCQSGTWLAPGGNFASPKTCDWARGN